MRPGGSWQAGALHSALMPLRLTGSRSKTQAPSILPAWAAACSEGAIHPHVRGMLCGAQPQTRVAVAPGARQCPIELTLVENAASCTS